MYLNIYLRVLSMKVKQLVLPSKEASICSKKTIRTKVKQVVLLLKMVSYGVFNYAKRYMVGKRIRSDALQAISIVFTFAYSF